MSQSDSNKTAADLVPEHDNALDFVKDVELKVVLEFGRGEFDIKELLSWRVGSVIQLDKVQGEPLEFRSNGNLVAKGEAVVVNEKYGVRITQIVNPQDFELEDV